MLPLRALPRIFLPGADPAEPIDLPKEEQDKLHKVLRLPQGAEIAVLPNDGSLIRCEYRARQAVPVSVEWPNTEPALKLTVAQAFPKGDRLDTVVRMCTEIGVSRFLLFPSDRSVVRWDEKKVAEKIRRYQALVREAAEQSYRCLLPTIEVSTSLAAVLKAAPDAVVLSEVEGLTHRLAPQGLDMTIVIGPEGGWSPKELKAIGDLGVTLGPLVLRTDTAAAAAAAVLLLG